MWRDRTNLFISYRQSYAPHPPIKTSALHGFAGGRRLSDERQGLMAGGTYQDDGDAVIELDVLPPRWLDTQDEVTELLSTIATQMRQLDQLHQKHVLPGFDDEHVKQREERIIEHLTQAITRNFQRCQLAIKRIDTTLRDTKLHNTMAPGEEAMAQNLKIALATRVGDVSSIFRKKQAAYLKKMRDLGGLALPYRAVTPVQNPYNDAALLDSDADRSFSQSTLLQTKQQRLRHDPNEALIVHREREINDIAQGIIELANIFQELQAMVIDQGSMLDRIDYNVENMARDVKEAGKELKVASGYQKRGIKRKIMLLLAILIAAVFILISLKLGRKSQHDALAVEQPPDSLLAFMARNRRESSSVHSSRNWHRRRRRLWTYWQADLL